MSASRIFELTTIMSGDVSSYIMLSMEWIASVILYFIIIVLANRGKGYSFGEVFNFSVFTSVFAAVIVGAASHIYIVEFISGGYAEYISRSIAAMQSVISEAQTMAAAQGVDSSSIDETMKLYSKFAGDSGKMIKDVSMNRPTIFSSVFSMASNYLISGAFFGCIAGIFVSKRKN